VVGGGRSPACHEDADPRHLRSPTECDEMLATEEHHRNVVDMCWIIIS
jgi:hypothetical protein